MKKCILFFWLFLSSRSGSAQYSLSFCEEVNTKGIPEMISNTFIQDKDGRALKIYLGADEKLNTTDLHFVIYFINHEGNEEEILKVVQRTEPDWTYAWKELILFNPGTYRVKVYNGNGTYLTSANLNIKHP